MKEPCLSTNRHSMSIKLDQIKVQIGFIAKPAHAGSWADTFQLSIRWEISRLAWIAPGSPVIELLARSTMPLCHYATWGREWMTKASGVGERRKGRGELRRDSHHRVAALFFPTWMQQWYMIYMYNNDILYEYMGEGGRGGPFAWKITWCRWAAPEYLLKQEDSG